MGIEKQASEHEAMYKRAEEILQIAEGYNVDKNFFFKTAFERYLVQLRILDELKKTIESDGVLVTKEYVKNRKNVYTHPAISGFNRTTDSANKTLGTLMKIIKNFNGDESADEAQDPLMRLINGDEDEEAEDSK